MGNFLATIGHAIGPFLHWLAVHGEALFTALAQAAVSNTGSPRSVLVYTAIVAAFLHFAPKALRKVRR